MMFTCVRMLHSLCRFEVPLVAWVQRAEDPPGSRHDRRQPTIAGQHDFGRACSSASKAPLS